MRPLDVKWKDSGRISRNAVLSVWLFGLASVVLPWVQATWYVFHPHYLPLFILFVGLLGTTILAVGLCLPRLVQGPERIRPAILLGVALLPILFWAYVGWTAKTNFERRWIPNTLTMRLAKAMGAAFIRAEADLTYRNRLETNRVLMFYDSLEHPREDLDEMDRHLARLEDLLGGNIQTQVYWIRGTLPRIGQGWLSVHGISLGSDSSPENFGNPGYSAGHEYRGDRHELAHAALESFRAPGSDPPCVLDEGFAMSQCGDASAELALAAAQLRGLSPNLGVREMLSPDWYYRTTPPVYAIGGAFVDFLIRTRGGTSFRRFALEIRPETVAAKCREIYGTELDDLETEFWEEVALNLSGPDEMSE